MSRTLRADENYNRRRVPEHKAQTWRGLDRCPPWPWRHMRATVPERREGASLARMVQRRVNDLDSLPAFGRAMMPWFT